jgi:hypothetical protein
MADVLPSELASSVMGKLYNVLANGDETVPKSQDHFFSWATPGIPVDPADFEFLSQGLTGVVKKRDVDVIKDASSGTTAEGAGEAGAGTAGGALTEADLERLRAADANRMYQSAENLSRMCDFIIDVSQSTNEQFARLNVLNTEGSLSDVYGYTLRMSQVMQTELPEETKRKIAELRGRLTTTVTKKNLIDGSETQVQEPSELSKLYFEKMAAYESAALEYNSRRINALSASTQQDVHYWAMNANILRNRVKAAMMDWVANGYKNDYEEISAFIDQVMRRDMSLLKEEYRDDLEKARLTGISSGSDFFYTSLIPGNFATSSGWSNFSFNSGEFRSTSNSTHSTSKWTTSAGGGWMGLFGGRGSGSKKSSHDEWNRTFNTDQFSLKFEIAQIPISQAWYKEAWMHSHAWRFDQSNPDSKDDLISDGGSPPKGLCPARATMAIFVRNLELKLGHSEGFDKWVFDHTSSSAGGGGFVNLGSLFLGGSHDRSNSSGTTTMDHGKSWNNQTFSVPGMQLIGFKCQVYTDKMPDPSPSITSWI